MERSHLREITFIECDSEVRFFDIQKVLVGDHQNGNLRQSGLSQNESVGKFVRWKQLFEESAGELLGDAVPNRFQIIRLDSPLPKIL